MWGKHTWEWYTWIFRHSYRRALFTESSSKFSNQEDTKREFKIIEKSKLMEKRRTKILYNSSLLNVDNRNLRYLIIIVKLSGFRNARVGVCVLSENCDDSQSKIVSVLKLDSSVIQFFFSKISLHYFPLNRPQTLSFLSEWSSYSCQPFLLFSPLYFWLLFQPSLDFNIYIKNSHFKMTFFCDSFLYCC